MTQPFIEDETDLSRVSVGKILDELKPILRPENGSTPRAPSRGGRPARLYHLGSGVGGIGVDLGRSHIKVGVQRLSGTQPGAEEIAGRDALDFEVAEEPGKALDLASEMIHDLLARDEAPTAIAGACVALAAPVGHRGRVRIGPFQAWADLDLRTELLSRLLDERISGDDFGLLINNDANLALKAEMRWGAARGVDTALFLKWATGIGLACSVESRVVRGSGGIAGEFGHTAVWEETGESEPCDWCGLRCLESVASLRALRPRTPRAELVAIISDAAHPQHRQLEREVERAGTLIGRHLAPVVSALNPRVVIVGGLGPESYPELCVPPIRDAIRESVMPSIARDVTVCVGEQQNGGGVVGALAAVFDEIVPDYLLRHV